jgi:SAM-dependent methyltransferase
VSQFELNHFRRVIERMRTSQFVGRVIPTLETELFRLLADASTVLDIGCGPKSPLSSMEHFDLKVGVEPFHNYAELARQRRTHHSIIEATIQELDFEPKSFDAVVLIDVIEHLSESDAFHLLKQSENWAKTLVVVSSPNGFIPQRALDGNQLQEHLSGWPLEVMRKMGYKSRGMAGPKWLRQEVQSETMGNDIFASIRFRPRMLWFALATIIQPISYRFPRFAFSLLSYKKFD